MYPASVIVLIAEQFINGTYRIVEGDLTNYLGETDLPLIGGATYRITVYKKGYYAQPQIQTPSPPPSGSEPQTYPFHLKSSQTNDNYFISNCYANIVPDTTCQWVFSCGEVTCDYEINIDTYTTNTTYTRTTYTGTTVTTLQGTINTASTVNHVILSGKVNILSTLNNITIYIGQPWNTTISPIQQTDITKSQTDYKIWFIIMLLAGAIIGIIFETSVLTGSGVYAMAAIWAISAKWIPSMIFPFLIIAAIKITIEIYKRLS